MTDEARARWRSISYVEREATTSGGKITVTVEVYQQPLKTFRKVYFMTVETSRFFWQLWEFGGRRCGSIECKNFLNLIEHTFFARPKIFAASVVDDFNVEIRFLLKNIFEFD